MQKIGSKIGFSDLIMGSWGHRPSFLALLCTNRGRGIDWRRFYSNRSRSWKVDFLTSPPPSSKGVVFQKFFFSILSSGTYILSILLVAEKFCDMWCRESGYSYRYSVLSLTLKIRVKLRFDAKIFFRFSCKNRLFRVISRLKIDCAHFRSMKN